MANKESSWSVARLKKFRKTMAAKKRQKSTEIPLDMIPARVEHKIKEHKPRMTERQAELILVAEVVKLVQSVINK